MREAVSNSTAAAAAAAASAAAAANTTTTGGVSAPDTNNDADHVIRAPATSAAAATRATATTSPVPAAPAAAVLAAPAATTSVGQATMKRPLTLDLNGSKSASSATALLAGGGLAAKRQRFNSSVHAAPVSVLNSPDLQMLKLASPELEKFMTNAAMQTPTPSLVYPQKVTTEQELYAKGFEDALNSLHNGGDAAATAAVQLKLEQPSMGVDELTTSTGAVAAAAAAAVAALPAVVAAAAGAVAPASDGTAASMAATAAAAAAVALTANVFAKIGNASAISAIGTGNISAAVAAAAGPPTTTNTTATTNATSILSNVGLSGGSITYTNLDLSSGSSPAASGNAVGVVSIKDEPLVAAASPPPHSPIDMDDQERIKLERKRQRNRVAASKCRKRKLERISKLEDKVKNLKSDNSDLGLLLKQLKENVCKLKQQVIEHINSGCDISMEMKSSSGGATAPEADIKQ